MLSEQANSHHGWPVSVWKTLFRENIPHDSKCAQHKTAGWHFGKVLPACRAASCDILRPIRHSLIGCPRWLCHQCQFVSVAGPLYCRTVNAANVVRYVYACGVWIVRRCIPILVGRSGTTSSSFSSSSWLLAVHVRFCSVLFACQLVHIVHVLNIALQCLIVCLNCSPQVLW